LEIGERVEAEGTELVRGEVLRVRVATELGRELQPVLVVLAEPREGVHELTGRGRRADIHAGVAAEGYGLHAGQSVGQRRVHADRPVRQIDERRAGEVHPVHADRRLGEDAEPEVTRVATLDAAVIVAALAAVRGQLGRGDARWILPAPRTVERQVERLAGRRRRRGEVDRSKETGLIAQPSIGNPADGRRYVRAVEDAEQAADRVAGESGRLKAQRVRVEQTVKILRSASGLICDGEERLVGPDGPGKEAADRQVAILLAERAG